MLTEEEIKAIEKKAYLAYPESNYEWINELKVHSRVGYIKALTSERIKAKALIEALVAVGNMTENKDIYDLTQQAINSYNTKQIEP